MGVIEGVTDMFNMKHLVRQSLTGKLVEVQTKKHMGTLVKRVLSLLWGYNHVILRRICNFLTVFQRQSCSGGRNNLIGWVTANLVPYF